MASNESSNDGSAQAARWPMQSLRKQFHRKRSSASGLRFTPPNIDLASVIAAAVETVEPAARGKAIALRCCLAPDVGSMGGSFRDLEQILWNLLVNAIKFTPARGEIWVLLEKRGFEARITVVDNGIGIRADLLPSVLGAPPPNGETTPTHGMGLAIVRELTHLHGGTVEASSDGEGRGARFVLRLPLGVPAPRRWRSWLPSG